MTAIATAIRARYPASRLPGWRRVASAGFWSLAGAIFLRAMGLVVAIVTARALGKEAFGHVAMVQSTMVMFSTLAGGALAITAARSIASSRTGDKIQNEAIVLFVQIAGVAANLAAGLVLAAVSGPIAAQMRGAEGLERLLMLSAPAVVLNGINSVQTGVLAGFEAFRAAARMNLVSGAVSFPISIAAVWLYGESGAVAAFTASGVLACAAGQLEIRRVAGPVQRSRVRAALRQWRLLPSFTLPALLSSGLVGPATWACTAMLARQPDGFSQLAVFHAAQQWRQIITFAPLNLATAAVPMLAEATAAGDGALSRIVRIQTILALAATLLTALPVLFFSQRVMASYGPSFQQGETVLALVAIGAIPTAVGNLLSKVMQAAGHAWLELSVCAAWSAALIGLSLWLVPERNAAGLAVAYLGAIAAQLVWQGVCVRLVVNGPGGKQ